MSKNWLPLHLAHLRLLERGMSAENAAAVLTGAISRFALIIKPDRAYDRQYGPSWITNPQIDVVAGTIAMPLPPIPGTWSNIQNHLVHVSVEVDREQFEAMFPSAAAGSHARYPNDDALAREAFDLWQGGSTKHAAASAVAPRALGNSEQAKIKRITRALDKMKKQMSNGVSKEV